MPDDFESLQLVINQRSSCIRSLSVRKATNLSPKRALEPLSLLGISSKPIVPPQLRFGMLAALFVLVKPLTDDDATDIEPGTKIADSIIDRF